MGISLSSFFQWRFNIFMCRLVGWKITQSYMRFLGKLYFFFNRKEQSRIKNAIKSVFDGRKEKPEIKSITRNVFKGIVMHYYEKFFNAFSSASTWRAFLKTHMENDGLATIKKALSKGNGVLLITGHFGGVEFIPGYLGLNNIPISIVVKFKSQYLRELSNQRTQGYDAKIIDPDKTPNVMKAISNDLKDNRVVITQCDELDEWRPCRKSRINFLGRKIHPDRTINILSKRCKTSVVFGIMQRNKEYGYKFIVTSWKEISKQYKRAKNMSLGEVVLKFMEQYIYNYPEEWYQWKKYPVLDIFSVSAPCAVTQPIVSAARPLAV